MLSDDIIYAIRSFVKWSLLVGWEIEGEGRCDSFYWLYTITAENENDFKEVT